MTSGERMARAIEEKDQEGAFGFRWGPLVVSRLAYIEGRGYVIRVRTEDAGVQVYVSEKGRRIRTYPDKGYRESRRISERMARERAAREKARA